MPVGVGFTDVTDCKEGGVLCQQGFIFTKYSWKSAMWWLVSTFLLQKLWSQSLMHLSKEADNNGTHRQADAHVHSTGLLASMLYIGF